MRNSGKMHVVIADWREDGWECEGRQFGTSQRNSSYICCNGLTYSCPMGVGFQVAFSPTSSVQSPTEINGVY